MREQELFSMPIERSVLGALLKFNNVFPEVDGFISEYDFYHPTHQTIYCIIRNYLGKGDKIDQVVLAQQIKNLNISTVDEIDIFQYVKILVSTQITDKGAIESCKELVKLRVRREIVDTTEKVKKFVYDNPDKSFDQIVTGADAIYNEKINSFGLNNQPVDLYKKAVEIINERAKNPVEEAGIITPYSEFNRMYGGIRAGNGVYFVVSRAKHGKSTWLANMAKGVVLLNPGCKVLYLDTEMDETVNSFRVGAAESNVPYWYLETGNWIKSAELAHRFKNEGEKEMAKYFGKIFHMKVTNKPIEEICSITRRFYFNFVGRGNPMLLIYDYLKLSGEKLSNYNQEHQAVGNKLQMLNDLGSELIIPIWSAGQQNRMGEDQENDTGAVVALSDRISWLAAFVGNFRRKWESELSDHGIQWGTHLMQELYTRFQGRDAAGHFNKVKIPTDETNTKFTYKTNFINYLIENFRITEKGTLRDIVEEQREKYDLTDGELSKDDAQL